MDLGATLSAVLAYFDSALSECGRPTCVSYLYLGQTGVLKGPGRCDCECEPEFSDGPIPQGVLRVSWRKVGPTSTPPQFQTVMGQTAPGVPLVELWVRVMRCWPGDAENTTVEQWDAAAAGIAADSDCLASAAHALICKKPGALAELGLAGCNAVGGYSVTPVWPEGGCAGNDLQLFARLSQ